MLYGWMGSKSHVSNNGIKVVYQNLLHERLTALCFLKQMNVSRVERAYQFSLKGIPRLSTEGWTTQSSHKLCQEKEVCTALKLVHTKQKKMLSSAESAKTAAIFVATPSPRPHPNSTNLCKIAQFFMHVHVHNWSILYAYFYHLW